MRGERRSGHGRSANAARATMQQKHSASATRHAGDGPSEGPRGLSHAAAGESERSRGCASAHAMPQTHPACATAPMLDGRKARNCKHELDAQHGSWKLRSGNRVSPHRLAAALCTPWASTQPPRSERTWAGIPPHKNIADASRRKPPQQRDKSEGQTYVVD
jgi:hypothetical protein